MEFSSSELYGISSIQELNSKLGYPVWNYFDSKTVFSEYKICIRDGRVLEIPSNRLKGIQERILKFLLQIPLPNYYNSRFNRSFIDNAKIHAKSKGQVLKTDIVKFFPKTSRNKIYNFWKEKLCVSNEVAHVLTNLTTIDYRSAFYPKDIYDHFKFNRISQTHLTTGTPTSIILSFLANIDMFNEIEIFANRNNFCLTVYVDDIAISSDDLISHSQFLELRQIVNKYGYHLKNHKTKIFNCSNPYILNGIMVKPDGSITLPNQKNKEIRELSKIGNNQKRLQGLISYKKYVNSINDKH